jgi:phosphatidylserine synthase
MRYKDIRKIAKIKPINEEVFAAYFFSRRLSPFFVNIFLKLNIIPNTITIYMIIVGIIGAIFFSFSDIWFKIVGYVFMHLWFIFDCSDGEVARITKVFSKFGKELDYIAHIINHPIFNIAFLISLIQLNKYNIMFISMVSIVLISSNLVGRNLISMYTIFELRKKSKNVVLNKKKLYRVIISYLIGFLTQYPNFVLIFPILYFIDVLIGTSMSLIYFLVITASSFLIVARSAIKTVYKFTKE